MTFTNSKEVADYIENHLEERGIEVQRSFTHHNPKSAHINLIEKSTGKCHHIKFATEPFHAFKHYFGRMSIGDKGETLDEKVLDSLNDYDMLYFGYPDKIYNCLKKEFTGARLFRTMKSGINVFSFPIECLEMFYGIEDRVRWLKWNKEKEDELF